MVCINANIRKSAIHNTITSNVNKLLNQYHKSIAWVLIVTVFTLLLLPVQIHIYHDVESVNHDVHAIDYHMMLAGVDDAEHFSHGDTHVLETAADVIVKQTVDNLFKAAIFVVLLLLVSLQIFSYYQQRFYSLHFRYQKYYSLSPPLRAPPLYLN